MKTMVLQKYRILRLLFLCLVTMLAALSIAMAQETLRMENARSFWVPDYQSSPPAFRKITASLRGSGSRSAIYVEDKLWLKKASPDYVNRLLWKLESALPSGAVATDIGIVPYLENLFGPLPRKFHGDERLIVLFADLAKNRGNTVHGFFHPFDQLPEAEAFSKYQQHSNEANVIYVNGFRRSDSYTAGLVAHELQLLLASGHSQREPWLSETLAQGAMLLTGHFTDQPRVNELAADSSQHPLVTLKSGLKGSQLLFSSYLLDSLFANGPAALAAISRSGEPGKSAVERVFREQTGAPLTFDAIFSNYASYVFDHSLHEDKLPHTWAPRDGIVIPSIRPYFTYKSSSGELSGQMPPYAFLAIDLAQELSPSVIIQTVRIDTKESQGNPRGCASTASVLWKPIEPTRIAVYAIGCDPSGGDEHEIVAFRLKILDQPSLIPPGSFKILR